MSASLLYLGTEDGLATYRLADGSLDPVGGGLAGESVRAVAVDPTDSGTAFVGCGLRGWGLYRATDAGRSFESLGFEDRWVWGVAVHPTDSDTLFVGTEPPGAFVSHDGGDTFERLTGVDDLPSRDDWFFFHDPFEAGHVHGFAQHPAAPDRLYAGVEHGALVLTRDGGETWREALVGHDLHRVELDPSDPDRVFAGAGAGLFYSEDAGDSWTRVDALAGKYVHGIEFDQQSPERLFVYAHDGEAPLYRSGDGGDTWTSIGEGLPPSRPADPLATVPGQPDTLLYAGDDDDGASTLYVSHDAGDGWDPVESGLPKVWRLTVAPEGEDDRLTDG